MAESDSAQAPARSPFAGCVIFLILAAVAIFLISVSIYSLIRQNREIDQFTDSTSRNLPTWDAARYEAQQADLEARLHRFHENVVQRPKEEAILSLSVDDLNIILATMRPLQDYRPHFWIKEIRPDEIVAAHTRMINGMPGSGIKRYLNADVVLKPVLAEKTLAFQVLSLTVPGKTVPREFIAQIPPYRLGADLQQDSVIGPVLQQLTAMEAKEGFLELRRIPGEVSTASVTDQQVDSAFLRILRVLICGFLLVVGLGLVFALRAKSKREQH